jgi:hypothetical protein
MVYQIFEAHSRTIYVLVDHDDKALLLKERLARARGARQHKQAERIQMPQDRRTRLQDWGSHHHAPIPSHEDMEAAPATLLDETVLDTDVDYNPTEDMIMKFFQELDTLATLPKQDMVNRNYANFPTVLRFAFPISSTSRAVPGLASNFIPFPCPIPVCDHYTDKLLDAESTLSNIERLDG